MKKLVLVRHGNTFTPGHEPTRVGRWTDPSLVEERRGLAAGRHIAERGLRPDRVFAGPLLRTRQTAALILRQLGLKTEITISPVLAEIDYGPDENRTEPEVVDRLGRHYLAREGRLEQAGPEDIEKRGQEAIELWNSRAVPPAGWLVNPEEIIGDWRHFASDINDSETVLAVSSNGIIRFAPYLLPSEEARSFMAGHNLKVTTGGVCLMEYSGSRWRIIEWNIKP